ncbi:hypothetical protein K470DRAFT_258846 [Piedraia hortae CBS 480.64]|uniref:Uncharacterized protein n=1 Tax=Piedraia hortae CBS 480.64 TaxID=1314780 RepID=A0A6A7BXR9_9PEZI|nr:hypothetical protein K470DRAFT_258846 [Piedraia hortae CBS 480.64]
MHAYVDIPNYFSLNQPHNIYIKKPNKHIKRPRKELEHLSKDSSHPPPANRLELHSNRKSGAASQLDQTPIQHRPLPGGKNNPHVFGAYVSFCSTRLPWRSSTEMFRGVRGVTALGD